jgi:hypothetical protein
MKRTQSSLANEPATQSRSNPVSGRCLPKAGIFQISAGDFRLVRSRTGQFRSPETDSQFANARHGRAFLRLPRVNSPDAGLVGWRRSADRTCLQPNSLLTGQQGTSREGSAARCIERAPAIPEEYSYPKIKPCVRVPHVPRNTLAGDKIAVLGSGEFCHADRHCVAPFVAERERKEQRLLRHKHKWLVLERVKRADSNFLIDFSY